MFRGGLQNALAHGEAWGRSDGREGMIKSISSVFTRDLLDCFARDSLRRRKALGVLLKPFKAEEFSADRLFQITKSGGRQWILIHSRNSGFWEGRF